MIHEMDEHQPVPPNDEPFAELPREGPRHGFRGDPTPTALFPGVPAGLTLAVSRQAGARGSTIGRRVGRLLGWPVYGQDLLNYMAQEGTCRQDVVERLSAAAASWVEQRLEQLLLRQEVSQHPSIVDLARVVLALGALGEVVLIGRGAGFLLPPATTLHVRIVAPLADRISYMSQWLRLPVAEATEQVRLLDRQRSDFLATHFHHQEGDSPYDLVLNSGSLGEELCAELIVRAVRARAIVLSPDEQDDVMEAS
jgi:cytidylate kinase